MNPRGEDRQAVGAEPNARLNARANASPEE
jgi:hypothetical protein